jgi:hypothetical protein
MPSTKKSPVRITISKEGALSNYGYSSKDNSEKRHRALRKASRGSSPTEVVRRLNAIAVLNKNRKPRLSAKFRADMHWVQKNLYPGSKPKSGSKLKPKSGSKSKMVVARKAYTRADGTHVKSVRVLATSPKGRKILEKRRK